MDLNPRVLRDQYATWVGKKVMIGTTDFHYVSGTVEAVEGDSLRLSVKGKPVVIPASGIANIKEAPALQAEYVK